MTSIHASLRRSASAFVAATSLLAMTTACRTTGASSKTADAGGSDLSPAATGGAPTTANDVDQGAASNAGLAQLSRYFGAWEVPNAAQNFPVTEVIGPVYKFKSPFGETYSGRDAMLKSITAFSAQTPPVSITMTTLSWNAVKNADGTIAATASVLGESQVQGATGATGISLAYQVNFDPITNAPPFINTMLETAVSHPQSETALTGHLSNAGRSTLYYWFFYFEEAISDPTPLNRLISTSDFSIQMDDGSAPVSTTADIATWYQTYAAKYKQAYNKVSNFAITEASPGLYDMSFDTLWTGVRKDGGLDQGSRHEVWKLTDKGGPFALIESRVVSVTTPVHSL